MTGNANYKVLSPIRCNGREYAVGGTIALTTELFEQLKPTGAIGIEPVGAAAEINPGRPSNAEERAAVIRAAVAGLTKSDLTKDGKPKVGAVEKIVGFDTTAGEIEAAMLAEPD